MGNRFARRFAAGLAIAFGAALSFAGQAPAGERPAAGDAVPALIAALADADPYVNGEATNALGRIGAASVPALVRALEDPRENVRWCAAIALGKVGPGARPAVPALVRALGDTNADVRYCAAIALGSIGGAAGDGPGAPSGRDALPALRESLHDADADVRGGAAWALAAIDPAGSARAPDWEATVATIERLTPLLMEELHVPGVSIALIRDGQVAWSKGYGVADAATREPVTNATLFEAASMTKPVFAWTVLKLVDEGKLKLDRPLVDYYDEPALPDQPERRRITARMVLSHTSGFPNWRKGDEEREGPLPVLFPPGSRFGYSGEGIFYLQRVVEQVTGEPLEVHAQRTLFAPLGLKSTSFAWTAELDPKLATGHAEDGSVLPRAKYTHANAAYSLVTTPEEYARFLVAIMKPDRSAPWSLSRRSREAMLAHQVEADAREPIQRPGRARGLETFWGLGWGINTTAAGDIVYHSGSNRTGFRCYSQFSPTRGSGIVIMTNGAGGGELWTRLISAVGDL